MPYFIGGELGEFQWHTWGCYRRTIFWHKPNMMLLMYRSCLCDYLWGKENIWINTLKNVKFHYICMSENENCHITITKFTLQYKHRKICYSALIRLKLVSLKDVSLWNYVFSFVNFKYMPPFGVNRNDVLENSYGIIVLSQTSTL